MKKKKFQNRLSGNFTKNALDSLGMTPRPKKQHQSVITDIAYFLESIFRKNKKSKKALPETELGGSNSLAPDVVVIDKETGENITFIEVTSSRSQKITFEKVVIAIKKFFLPEGFIYNYQTKKWYRVDKQGKITNDTKSETLGIDMKDIEIE